MKKHNFDEIIERKETYSLKYDLWPEDVTPMWVADMDFRTAPEIRERLAAVADYGVFGYTNQPEELTALIIDRLKKMYSWDVKPEEILIYNGIVPAMNLLCRTMKDPDSKLVNLVPVYYPFFQMGPNSDLPIANIQMLPDGLSWVIDFGALEKEFSKGKNLLLLSNPQNPLGRIFTKAELSRLAELCVKYDVTVASDEIHCDLILDKDKKHIPIASLNEEIAKRTVTFLSPTKTWNLAGIQFSFAVVQNPEIRSAMAKAGAGLTGRLPVFSYNAALYAYKYGQDWLDQLLDYLRTNRDKAIESLHGYMGLKVTQPLEATYLLWIDHSSFPGVDVHKVLLEKAKVGLSAGKPFGSEKHVRMNLACPASVLDKSLAAIKQALKEI